MKLEVIKSKKEYEALLSWVEVQFDKKISPDSPVSKQLEIALFLIKKYEAEHSPV